MSQPILSHCPVCDEALTVTRLSCRHCGLELSNEFTLSKFLLLSSDDLLFIDTFLENGGNFREIQSRLHISYPALKKRLRSIQGKLGHSGEKSPLPPEIIMAQLPIYQDESPVVKSVKEKLNRGKGLAEIALPRGHAFYLWYEEFGNGLHAGNLPSKFVITWLALDCAAALLSKSGGRAPKGNAMKSRLGEGALTLDTVEGYVAAHAFGAKEGASVLRIIPALSAILEWAGICRNGYGYLELL